MEKRYESAQTFWVALTPSRNDNGGMFYYPDDRTIFPHEFDLAYPMFKCIDLQANGISREQLVDAELDAGDVLVRPARTAQAATTTAAASCASACRSSSSRTTNSTN
ncbi:phytanoyl-CoA dioxygenase family protein [Pseudomonas aeruginosa]|nr:phytanoyl-CoA dioxygenase family protein [Pseudomonas aeruginosa]